MAAWLQPVAKSMILCLDVWPGPPGTGNVHLVNVCTAIRSRSMPPFPYHLNQLCVFLELTDAEGEASGSIQVRRAETDQVIFTSSDHHIRFPDRLHITRANFRITDCVFPAAGVYLVEFHLDEHWIVDRRLHLYE